MSGEFSKCQKRVNAYGYIITFKLCEEREDDDPKGQLFQTHTQHTLDTHTHHITSP